MFPQYHGGDPTHGYYTLGDDDEWRMVAMNDQGIGYWTTEEGEHAGWMHRAVINPETGMVRLDEEGNPLMYVVPTVSGAFTPSGRGGAYETNPFDYGFSNENVKRRGYPFPNAKASIGRYNWGGPDMEGYINDTPEEWLDDYNYTDYNCPIVLGLGSMFVTTLLFTAMIFVSYKTVKWAWKKVKKK